MKNIYFFGFIACLLGTIVTALMAYACVMFGEYIPGLGFLAAMVFFIALAVQAKDKF